MKMALAFLALGICCSSAATENVSYLDTVRAYADTMMDKGRGRWGEQPSPLFATMMNRETHDLFHFKEIERVVKVGVHVARPKTSDNGKNHNLPAFFAAGRAKDERMYDSANVGQDEFLYSLLYLLSDMTGAPKYAQAADDALRYFWLNCQDPNTGLMCWGEHLGWYLPGNVAFAPSGNGRIHELWYTPWPHFDRCFRMGTDVVKAIQRFALGEWTYQIYDHEKSLWNRHAMLDGFPNVARTGAEFPRLIGQMTRHWALAYEHSHDEAFRTEMLRAIDSIISNTLKRRKPSGAVGSRVGTDDKSNELWVLQHALNLALLHEVAGKLPDSPLRRRVLELRDSFRNAVVKKLDHPLTTDRGYVIFADVTTLKPGINKRPGYSSLWSSHSTAAMALRLLEYDAAAGDNDARALALKGAALYLRDDALSYPPRMLPGTMADAIELIVRAYKLTNDGRYLKQGDRFGRDAIRLFLDTMSPLPKIMAANDKATRQNYDSATRGDDLMLALLKLHVAIGKEK